MSFGGEHPLVQRNNVPLIEQEVKIFQPVDEETGKQKRMKKIAQGRVTFRLGNNWKILRSSSARPEIEVRTSA